MSACPIDEERVAIDPREMSDRELVDYLEMLADRNLADGGVVTAGVFERVIARFCSLLDDVEELTPHSKETPVSDTTIAPTPTAEQLAYMEKLAPLVAGLNALAQEARRNSVEHGFGSHGDRLRRRLESTRRAHARVAVDEFADSELIARYAAALADAQADYDAYVGNRLMLIAGEVTEAHEEVRSGQPHDTRFTEKGKPEGVGSELADIVIRTLETAVELGYDMEAELMHKMPHNFARPAMHGRKF